MKYDNTQMDIATFLVASIHDMKNSVSVMSAVLGDVLKSIDPHRFPESGRIGQVYYEAQRVNDHLIQLLGLYKIQQGYYPFDPQDWPLEDFVAEVMDRVRPLAESRSLTVTADCPNGVMGYFDRELICGIVVQALNNALRYTRSQVRLSVAEARGQLTIRVEDDGRGFPEHMLRGQGTEPNQAVSFTSGSTGLGLYFSTIAAAMHKNHDQTGATRLENGGSLGGGVFILTLP